ncbi:hypothetical protein ACOSQ2_009418 [Xanthoceras sorbifolium]
MTKPVGTSLTTSKNQAPTTGVLLLWEALEGNLSRNRQDTVVTGNPRIVGRNSRDIQTGNKGKEKTVGSEEIEGDISATVEGIMQSALMGNPQLTPQTHDSGQNPTNSKVIPNFKLLSDLVRLLDGPPLEDMDFVPNKGSGPVCGPMVEVLSPHPGPCGDEENNAPGFKVCEDQSSKGPPTVPQSVFFFKSKPNKKRAWKRIARMIQDPPGPTPTPTFIDSSKRSATVVDPILSPSVKRTKLPDDASPSFPPS